METQHPGPSWKTIFIGLTVGLVFAIVYLVAAKQLDTWPYNIPKSNEVTDLKTYQNAEYGFTLEYPDAWHSEECKDSGPGGTYVLASFGDAEQLVVCNSDAPINSIVNVVVVPGTINQQEVEAVLSALDSSTRREVTIDGQPAIRIQGITLQQDGPGPEAGLTEIIIYAERDGAIYRVMFVGEASDVEKFESTIKTFKFGKVTPSILYSSTQYGFRISLPESWKGYTVTTAQWEGQNIATPTAPGERGPLLSIRHPQWTTQNPRQDIPIMVFTLAQWERVGNEEISLGAAPVPPSLLARNSLYVLALPARYNYAFPPGWEEVDELVHTLQAFEPAN